MQETLSFTSRLAKFSDLDLVKDLLTQSGLPIEKIEEQFNQFILFHSSRAELIACAGLEIYGTEGLIRSVAVTKSHQQKGLGSILVQEIEKQAKEKKLHELYLLTDTAEIFFSKHGYQTVPRELVPMTIQNSFEYTSSCKITATVMKKSLL